MININFRRFFCKVFGNFFATHWHWMYDRLDCVRYEPAPAPPEWVEVKVCLTCDKLAVGGCAISKIIKITFVKGDEPTEECVPSQCCKILPPPPPEINKLIPEKQYRPPNSSQLNGTSKLVCPVLYPTYGINLKTTDEEAEEFADRFAREGWGNFMRLFVAGNWEPFYQRIGRDGIISMPYHRAGEDDMLAPWDIKFSLDHKNDDHFDSLFRRAGYLADRYIMPMFTLLDNCSIHIGPGKRQGWWATHWMNGDNNVNGTSNEAYSQTHWYEYDGESEYHHPGDVREGMKETGEYLMELYGYVLDKAKEYLGDFFLIEIGNEIDAANQYHKLLRKFINERLGQGNLDGRVFTSLKHDHFYEKKDLYSQCIPVIHGVEDYVEYEERKELALGKKHGASQDGREPMKTAAKTKRDVLYILESESVMYEGNIRPLFVRNKLSHGGLSWTNLIRAGRHNEIDWTLKSLPFDLCRAFGGALNIYLGG